LRNFLIFIVSALVAGGTVLGFYTIWSRDVARLQQDLKKEQLREAELRGVQELNRRYQQQLQQLEVRINTIQTLQNSKSGPVAFMTALADVVNRTGDLYLFSVAPEGERLAIKGQSSTVESMAQFIAALKHSGSFQDVQLRQYWEDDQQNRVAYKFNLDCIYRSPAAVAPAAAPGTQRAGM
jgi:Tfp pilus assembly protein PilN